MSYMMCSRITFPANKRREELVIYTISSVHIESSWKMLTDSAEIVLPGAYQILCRKRPEGTAVCRGSGED
ncbi:hypothetical protein [Bacteroides xylanisolvens]|uniref:hypothetical protein n=1 Tax=Bacteroides xylanisolvens TaxID=371601 RepID=UPI002165FB77|nr:hypothetical protein [Bacteroides xylanisolvens]MCS3379335.1 hypothetical protein [Bacteroides xylanisolvens]